MGTGNTWFDDLEFTMEYCTIEYTTSSGERIRSTIPCASVPRAEPPELQEGDTTALDEFLGGFGNAKE